MLILGFGAFSDFFCLYRKFVDGHHKHLSYISTVFLICCFYYLFLIVFCIIIYFVSLVHIYIFFCPAGKHVSNQLNFET